MKRALVLVWLLFSVNALAQNIAGDWHGTLRAGQAELRLDLHFTKAPDGGYTATMDSLDQGAKGIPVSSVALKDSKLNLTVDAVHGAYEGKVSADGAEITGTWTQGQALPLDLKRGTFPVKPDPKPAGHTDIDGDWMGTLDTGAAKLRLAFHISNTDQGLIATLDSLDQGAMGMPVTMVTRAGASLKMELKQIGGTFDGKISADSSAISGTWAQGGGILPLVLERSKAKP